MSKAREKICLRVDLNKDNEEACLMDRGKSFHNFGAATAKAWSPLSLRFVLWHIQGQLISWPERTGGMLRVVAAQKCKVGQAHLGIYNKYKHLNWILKCTGSQQLKDALQYFAHLQTSNRRPTNPLVQCITVIEPSGYKGMDYCLKDLAWEIRLYFGQLPQLEKNLF